MIVAPDGFDTPGATRLPRLDGAGGVTRCGASSDAGAPRRLRAVPPARGPMTDPADGPREPDRLSGAGRAARYDLAVRASYEAVTRGGPDSRHPTGLADRVRRDPRTARDRTHEPDAGGARLGTRVTNFTHGPVRAPRPEPTGSREPALRPAPGRRAPLPENRNRRVLVGSGAHGLRPPRGRQTAAWQHKTPPDLPSGR
ncbi:hypothetical protein GCM10010517_65950 [Streptosporangium fragile]|uniref:Uncharacterized protein n=1 Tax=Streptosporangium fragile TaxID=46186 RepID=A0ABN3W7N9_9ACTN